MLDHGRPPAPPRQVYVIRDDTGLHKIGMSKYPAARLRILQQGYPRKLSLSAVFDCPDGLAFMVEQAAHNLLHAKRCGREWFSVSHEEAVQAVEQARRQVLAEGVPRGHLSIQVRLEPVLHARLTLACLQDGRSMTALVTSMLVEGLKRR